MVFTKGASLFFGAAACSGFLFAGSIQAIQLDKLVVVDTSDIQTVKVDKLVVIGASNTAPPATGTAAVGDIPMGQSAGEKVSLLPEDAKMSDSDDLFGGKGGYIHINALVQGEYTDNVYNVDQNKTTNFLTTVSPALWFSLPRKKDIPVSLAPNNTSAGGLSLQPKDYQGTDRYQAYALGGLDFKMYSRDSELNTINGIGEGMFRYNMRGGLSLMAVDRYSRDSDRFDVGSTVGVVNKFDSNIMMATVDWNITEKLRGKFDYSNFYLGYDEDTDSFKDRVDNSFDLYGYFNYSVKTAFFLQGKFVDVQYDTATANDNQQNFVFGGIKWDTTEKVSLMAKAGVQNRRFENSESTADTKLDDNSELALDVQAVYKFTERANISLDVYRADQETDSTVASGKTVLGANLGYNQKFTDKISGSLAAKYEDAQYEQLVAQDRDDTSFSLKPAAQYLFREWLMGEVSYQFENRDSTDNLFDFQTNTFFANVKFAL